MACSPGFVDDGEVIAEVVRVIRRVRIQYESRYDLALPEATAGRLLGIRGATIQADVFIPTVNVLDDGHVVALASIQRDPFLIVRHNLD